MELNRFFDHTLLKPDATVEEITKLCLEAIQYKFMSVCVNPCHVPLCKKILAGSGVKVCTVIGFPLGAMSPKAKVAEARDAVAMGADEVDMVQNIGAVKEGRYDFVAKEIRMIKNEVKGSRILKVILETCYLTDKEIELSCKAAVAGGADFVKTSTGFGPAGATVKDVKLMRYTVGPRVGVKAAGGIHTKAEVYDMIAAGANRIGCSRSAAIMKEN